MSKIGLYHNNEIWCDVQGSGDFYVKGDDAPQKNMRDATLKGLYKKIDAARKVKFTPIFCYAKRYQRIHKGRITSLHPGRDRYSDNLEHMARFVGEGGQPRCDLGSSWHEKQWKTEAYPMNAHNNNIVEQMEVIEIAIQDLKDEREQLEMQLQTFADLEEKKARQRAAKEIKKLTEADSSEDEQQEVSS